MRISLVRRKESVLRCHEDKVTVTAGECGLAYCSYKSNNLHLAFTACTQSYLLNLFFLHEKVFKTLSVRLKLKCIFSWCNFCLINLMSSTRRGHKTAMKHHINRTVWAQWADFFISLSASTDTYCSKRLGNKGVMLMYCKRAAALLSFSLQGYL